MNSSPARLSASRVSLLIAVAMAPRVAAQSSWSPEGAEIYFRCVDFEPLR